MKVVERVFSRDQWLNLLNDFSDLVADKEYTKINYDDWRILSKPVSSNVVLELYPGLGKAPIIFIQSGANTLISVEVNDGSLGDFLFENIFNKEEQAMSMNNSSIETKLASITYENTVLTQGNNYYSNSTTTVGDITGMSVSDKTQELEDKINQRPTFNNVNKMIEDKMKEKENVNMKGFNFDFGPCTGDQVRMSMYGMAVKNAAGTYVSYNPNTKEIIDVDILNFDGAKYMYKIPVAMNDIALGDIIIHNRKPMFVVALSADGSNTLTCVDVCAGEQKEILLTKSPFGFNFATKIVSLFNLLGDNAPTPDAPFGNMLPLMLMSGNDEKIDPVMLMCMMQGNGSFASNPMMLYMLMKDNKDIDPMVFMLMSGVFNPNH